MAARARRRLIRDGWRFRPHSPAMTSRTFLHTAIVILLSSAAFHSLRADDLPPPERVKIEALITHLETLDGARFVRNGSDYDSKTAAKFLRGKWQAQEKQIKTAPDFIAKAASSSATSGKPYLIRLPGAPETPCADYLTARLKELEDGVKEK